MLAIGVLQTCTRVNRSAGFQHVCIMLLHKAMYGCTMCPMNQSVGLVQSPINQSINQAINRFYGNVRLRVMQDKELLTEVREDNVVAFEMVSGEGETTFRMLLCPGYPHPLLKRGLVCVVQPPYHLLASDHPHHRSYFTCTHGARRFAVFCTASIPTSTSIGRLRAFPTAPGVPNRLGLGRR